MGTTQKTPNEFLVLFAIIITVSIISVAIISHFDVIDLLVSLPETCAFTPPLKCEAFTVGSYGVSVDLSNTAHRSMIITKIYFEGEALSGKCESEDLNVVLRQNDVKKFIAFDTNECAYTGLDTLARYVVKVEFTWQDSPLAHFVTGELLSSRGSGTFVSSVTNPGATKGTSPIT